MSHDITQNPKVVFVGMESDYSTKDFSVNAVREKLNLTLINTGRSSDIMLAEGRPITLKAGPEREAKKKSLVQEADVIYLGTYEKSKQYLTSKFSGNMKKLLIIVGDVGDEDKNELRRAELVEKYNFIGEDITFVRGPIKAEDISSASWNLVLKAARLQKEAEAAARKRAIREEQEAAERAARKKADPAKSSATEESAYEDEEKDPVLEVLAKHRREMEARGLAVGKPASPAPSASTPSTSTATGKSSSAKSSVPSSAASVRTSSIFGRPPARSSSSTSRSSASVFVGQQRSESLQSRRRSACTMIQFSLFGSVALGTGAATALGATGLVTMSPLVIFALGAASALACAYILFMLFKMAKAACCGPRANRNMYAMQ